MCHARVQRTYRQLEASDSSPSHSLSWSLARRPLSSYPNTKHCLEICVTLTDELGAVPHPLIPGWHPLWKICSMMLGPDSPKWW